MARLGMVLTALEKGGRIFYKQEVIRKEIDDFLSHQLHEDFPGDTQDFEIAYCINRAEEEIIPVLHMMVDEGVLERDKHWYRIKITRDREKEEITGNSQKSSSPGNPSLLKEASSQRGFRGTRSSVLKFLEKEQKICSVNMIVKHIAIKHRNTRGKRTAVTNALSQLYLMGCIERSAPGFYQIKGQQPLKEER